MSGDDVIPRVTSSYGYDYRENYGKRRKQGADELKTVVSKLHPRSYPEYPSVGSNYDATFWPVIAVIIFGVLGYFTATYVAKRWKKSKYFYG